MNRTVWTCAILLIVLTCSWGLCLAGEPSPTPPEGPTLQWGDYTISLDEHGNLRRMYEKWGLDEIDAMVARAQASGIKPNVWRVALVLVPTFDVTWKDDTGAQRHTVATLTPEQMDIARECFQKTVRWVYAFSGGNLKWETAEFVFTEPVVYVTPPEQKGPFFPPTLVNEMVAAFPDWKPGEFDGDLCVFPVGDMQLDALGRGWGQLHGELKAGNSNLGFFADLYASDAGKIYMVNVMLHEWLHQAEAVMIDNLGYRGLPALHDSAKSGYVVNELGFADFTCWYRDFMLRLFRPAMWQRGDMNTRSWQRPVPAFDGGYITQWLVRGPFSNMGADGKQTPDHGLDTDSIGGEAAVTPSAGETGAFPVSDSSAWHLFDTATQYDPLPDTATDEQRQERAKANEIVDLTRAFTPSENGVGYAHVYVHADRTQKAVLWIGSDDGVKVYLGGIMVLRNRIDRGVIKDEDRVPVMVIAGWNRLLVKVDQGVGGWGFSARFSTTDDKPLDGLTTSPTLPEGATLQPGQAVPVGWDRKLYAWADVRDDPWGKLPMLSEGMLRAITGLEGLRLEARDGALRIDPGPLRRVLSPLCAAFDMADAQLNNQLTYGNESLAWLRYHTTQPDRRFAYKRRDLLLVRWDLIDAWLDLLQSHSWLPADKSLLGYVTVDRQLAYVVYTDLGEHAPGRELDLVAVSAGGVTAMLTPERPEPLTGSTVGALVWALNATRAPATLKRLTVSCDDPGVAVVAAPLIETRIAPGAVLAERVPLLSIAPDAEPGLKLLRVQFDVETASGTTTLSSWAAVEVKQPIGIELTIAGPSIVRSGRSRAAKLVLTNNASHAGIVTWRVDGGAVKAKPAFERFIMRPTPTTTEDDLTLAFRRTKRTARGQVVAVVDIDDGKVPDSRSAVPMEIGASRALWRYDFEDGLQGWHVRTGAYAIEHVAGREMNGRGYALIKDGGGGKYGNLAVFGPEYGAEEQWRAAYSSDEYPMIECSIGLKDTGPLGIIVQVGDTWYGIALCGALAEGKGVDKVIGDLALPTDGTVQKVRFDLDAALDAALGEGDHAVRQIWLGDRRFSANREPGPNVGTIMIDDFTVR